MTGRGRGVFSVLLFRSQGRHRFEQRGSSRGQVAGRYPGHEQRSKAHHSEPLSVQKSRRCLSL